MDPSLKSPDAPPSANLKRDPRPLNWDCIEIDMMVKLVDDQFRGAYLAFKEQRPSEEPDPAWFRAALLRSALKVLDENSPASTAELTKVLREFPALASKVLETREVPLPDEPLFDESILVPFDLPGAGRAKLGPAAEDSPRPSRGDSGSREYV